MKKKTLILIIVILAVIILAIAGYIIGVNIYAKNKQADHIAGILKDVENGEQPEWNEYQYCDRSVLMGGGRLYSDNKFNLDGIIYIDDRAGIEKAEIKLAMEYDYIQYKEDYEEYILKTIDITDILRQETEESRIAERYQGVFKKYSYSAEGIFAEEDGFNRDRHLSYVIIITFKDGYEAEVFASS